MGSTGDTATEVAEVEKIELYVTSSSGVRQTYQECLDAKRILETLMVEFEEKDVFANPEAHEELKQRLETDQITVPQLFVDEKHIGNAEKIEQLNETGELRKIFFPNKEFPEVNSSLNASAPEENED